MPYATETSLSDRSPLSFTVFAAAFACVLLRALPAGAQDADSSAVGTGSVVKQTYGAWQVSCRTPPGAKEEKCALVQSVTAEGRPNVGVKVGFFKSIGEDKKGPGVGVP